MLTYTHYIGLETVVFYRQIPALEPMHEGTCAHQHPRPISRFNCIIFIFEISKYLRKDLLYPFSYPIQFLIAQLGKIEIVVQFWIYRPIA